MVRSCSWSGIRRGLEFPFFGERIRDLARHERLIGVDQGYWRRMLVEIISQ